MIINCKHLQNIWFIFVIENIGNYSVNLSIKTNWSSSMKVLSVKQTGLVDKNGGWRGIEMIRGIQSWGKYRGGQCGTLW